MGRTQTRTCSRWDCSAVLHPETETVVAYGDDGEAVGLCPCCAKKEGY